MQIDKIAAKTYGGMPRYRVRSRRKRIGPGRWIGLPEMLTAKLNRSNGEAGGEFDIFR